MEKMVSIGIVGASGYVGNNLLKILKQHEHASVKIATSSSLAGQPISKEFPGLDYDLEFTALSIDKLNSMDIVFLAVPHGEAKAIVPKLETKVIDLTSDHRVTHTYGLPEVFKEEIKHAGIVANPGCYATACILSVYPIKGMVDKVVFDCISGYSGGGKNAREKYDYGENIIAYKLTQHDHKKEMKKVLGIDFSFTPHVADTFSGIMCTAHVFMSQPCNPEMVKETYKRYYHDTLTGVVDRIPCTKEVVGTPYCLIGGFEQEQNELVIISVIDNLMKGAASQAVENMNIMLGFDPKEGLL